MKILFYLVIFVVVSLAGLFVWSQIQAAEIVQKHPPAGSFHGNDGERMHFHDIPAEDASLPPLLFIHGASGNLNDQRGAYEEKLRGQARMIFIDRPGHGYSQLGASDDPAKQASRYVEVLDHLGIDKAVLVCHSLGCASGAAFAVNHPERVKGLVFVSPATHPWPGGVTWYYDVASLPYLGWLFTETLVIPAGRAGIQAGVQSVFSPNEPPENYPEISALELVFRPHVFRNNARDVATLKAFVTEFSPRYKEIDKPTVIITGDKDDVVLPEIHSVGLERDIEGAELIVLPDTGHKPDYAATEVVVAAIRKVAK